MSPLKRFQIGLTVLLVLPFFSYLNFFWQNAPLGRGGHGFIAPPQDDWAVHSEKQFRRVREFLPSRGTVGFVSDQEDTMFQVRYYGAQYALAPLILRHDARAPIVLCLFTDPKRLRDAQQSKTLSQWTELGSKRRSARNQRRTPLLLHDFGDGLMLFRNARFREAH